MNTITMITDGSSLIKGNYYESSSSVIIYINDIFAMRLGCFHMNGTNSLGELYAFILGLDRISDIIYNNPELKDSKISIISDSEYVVNSLTVWYKSWIKKGIDSYWISSSGKPVMYQDKIRYLLKNYILEKDIDIYHMRGHVNQKVDFNKAYKKFCNKYNTRINEEDFSKMVDLNNQADRLAEYIRINKFDYYEELGETEWVKSQRKNQIRNGSIVVKGRNLKRD